MHNRRPSLLPILALFLCGAHVPTVVAQTPPGRDPVAVSRAARDADNPMRVIIEASKLKARIRPDGDSVEANAPEKRAARPAAAKASAQAPATAALKTPAAASQALATPPDQTLGKAVGDTVPTALAAPAFILPTPKAEPAALLPLKLAQLVQPTLPESVLRRLRNDVEVVVGFTVNADGSVSNVAVRSSPIKALETFVVEAVSQWRYQPIGEARPHVVQLVLRADH